MGKAWCYLNIYIQDKIGQNWSILRTIQQKNHCQGSCSLATWILQWWSLKIQQGKN